MQKLLFRKEVLEANKSRIIGNVALYCPPWRWVIIFLVALITISIVLFFTLGSYTKRESASGSLVPEKGTYNIIPPMAGTVIDILVKEGDVVKQGDPLLHISGEISSSLGKTREKIATELASQRERLLKDLESTSVINETELEGMKHKLAFLESQVRQLKLQKHQRQKQISLSRVKLDKLKMMQAKGFASNAQLDEQAMALLEAQARELDTQRQIIDVQQQLAMLHQQIKEQPYNARNKVHDLQSRISELDKSLAENESRRAVIITAPQDSIVGTILTKTGKIVNANQSVLSLLPMDSPMQARMLVNSRSIGFIRNGQKVVLRYQAYPYQKFGQQYGKVLEVSRTALSPLDVSNLLGVNNNQEPLYRVTVQLNKQTISAYGREEPLRPGMAVEADFMVDNRRLAEWVLEPLYALGKRASM